MPTHSDPNTRQSYYQQMNTTLKDPRSGCNNCKSVFGSLHEAAHKLSPDDISWILVQLCKDNSFFNNGDDCDQEYGGSGGSGLYMAKALYFLDETTHDMSAACKFNYKVKDCPPPPVAQIKEADWFKSSKPSQQKTAPKPDSSGMENYVMFSTDTDWVDRQDLWCGTYVRCSFGHEVSDEHSPEKTETALTFEFIGEISQAPSKNGAIMGPTALEI